MFVYICIYIYCIFIYMIIYTHNIYIRIYIHVYICVYACKCLCTSICLWRYVYTYIYVYLYVYLYVYVYVYCICLMIVMTHIYIYIHKCYIKQLLLYSTKMHRVWASEPWGVDAKEAQAFAPANWKRRSSKEGGNDKASAAPARNLQSFLSSKMTKSMAENFEGQNLQTYNKLEDPWRLRAESIPHCLDNWPLNGTWQYFRMLMVTCTRNMSSNSIAL